MLSTSYLLSYTENTLYIHTHKGLRWEGGGGLVREGWRRPRRRDTLKMFIMFISALIKIPAKELHDPSSHVTVFSVVTNITLNPGVV